MNGHITPKFKILNIVMIEIVKIIFKKRKSFEDYIKLAMFGFFLAMAVSYIGHIKPLESDE